MKAFPMFVLPLNNLVTMKIMIVEITRPNRKITAGLSNSNYAIMIVYYGAKINSYIVFLEWCFTEKKNMLIINEIKELRTG